MHKNDRQSLFSIWDERRCVDVAHFCHGRFIEADTRTPFIILSWMGAARRVRHTWSSVPVKSVSRRLDPKLFKYYVLYLHEWIHMNDWNEICVDDGFVQEQILCCCIAGFPTSKQLSTILALSRNRPTKLPGFLESSVASSLLLAANTREILLQTCSSEWINLNGSTRDKPQQRNGQKLTWLILMFNYIWSNVHLLLASRSVSAKPSVSQGGVKIFSLVVAQGNPKICNR